MSPRTTIEGSSSTGSAPVDEESEILNASGKATDSRETLDRTALLLGNVNVGKTTLFSRVCGKRHKVSNYPGTSISIRRGTFSERGVKLHLIDTPGINSMMPESEDEKISWNILLDEKPDIIALVADGKQVRKSLLLMLQLAEFETSIFLNINMMDEARQRGIRIDTERLSLLLGVPVTETVATEGEGVESFRKAFVGAGSPCIPVSYPPKLESAIRLAANLLEDSGLPTRALGTAVLTGDEEAKRCVLEECGEEMVEQLETVASDVQSAFNRPLSAIIMEARLQAVDQVLSEVESISPPARMPLSEKIGEWSRRPLTGVPIAAFVVLVMYLFVGQFGAQTLVGVFEGVVFGEWIVPAARRILAWIPNQFVTDALVGEFGLISVGLTLAFGVVVPVLATFFFAFGVLEDSGYLPRISVLLDRTLRKIGLNGKGILPLVLGFSCITMAILTTRMLESKRERFIATLLLVLGFPCAPLLAVMLVLLADMSIWASVVVFGVIVTQIIVIGFILAKILPGGRSDFIIELPAIRIPKLRSLLRSTMWRVWWFIKDAVPLFLLATFILFLLEKVGTLAFIERAGEPIMTGFLGLPQESAEVIIMTLIRRESGAAMLKQFADAGAFDTVQVVVCLLVLTFLSPCVNTVLVMLKERGTKATLVIMAFVTSYALVVGATVNWVCRALGVTFG